MMSADGINLSSIGALLRAARESQSLSVEKISSQLHLSEKQIQALEQDDFQSFRTSMLEYCRPKFRFVQVQTVNQNELNQIIHVFQPAHGFAVLKRVTFQGNQMKQRNHPHLNAFDHRLDRRPA